MRRLFAAALVIVPLSLASAEDAQRPPEAAAQAPATKKHAKHAKAKAPAKPASSAAAKDAPPARAGAAAPEKKDDKKAEPPPCEEVKPCPID